MSTVAPSPVRVALATALSADTELMNVATGVHHRLAPEKAKPPYVVFQRMSSVNVWSMRDAFQNELWMVKGICRGQKADEAEALDDRCQEILNDAQLTIVGGDLMLLRRESAIEGGDPPDSGEQIYQVGSLYRLYVERAA